MDVKVKAYGKVLVLTVSGPVTAEDVVIFDQELPALYKDASAMVVSFKKAEINEGILNVLVKIRDKHGFKKTKLIFVSPTLVTADFKTIELALESVNTSDALRVVDILKASIALREKTKELESLRLDHANLLREGLGEAKGAEPMTADVAEKYAFRLKEAMRRQQYLFKTIGAEITAIQKAAAAAAGSAVEPSDGRERAQAMKAAVLAALKEANVL